MKNPYPWTKFFWNDWENDPVLRLCSLGSQGLWMRLLCICAKSDPIGFLTVEGQTPSHDDLALLIGRPVSELLPLLDELSERGVFSRDAKGRIYSRRMVRDAKLSAQARKLGKRGGNPSLLKDREKSEGDNPPDKGWDKPKNSESRIQIKTPEGPPADRGKGRHPAARTAEVSTLDVGWHLPEEWRELAVDRGWSETAIMRQAGKFKNYFAFGRGAEIKRGARGWKQTWLNWLKRELRSDPDAATFGKADKSGKLPPSYPPLPEPVLSKLHGHYGFKDVVIKRWLEPCLIDLAESTITAPTRFHADYLESHYGPALEHALGCQFSIRVGKTHS